MLAQGAFVIWMTVDLHSQVPNEPIGAHFAGAVLTAWLMTVLLTNGYGLLCRTASRIFARVSKVYKASGNSLSLPTSGRHLRKPGE